MPRMGTKKTARSGLADALFSKVQQRVLGLIFGEPDKPLHAREIIRLAGSGSGAVQRELQRLVDAGIVSVVTSGNRKLYQPNRESPVFKDLRGLITKTVGLVEPLRRALRPLQKKISAAFVFGSVAKGGDTAGSDIDLMIVADGLTYADVFAALQGAENALRRRVNPNLMTREEWKQKMARKNHFVIRIAQQKRLFVIGSDRELA